jgi:hypothetical protein
MTARNVNESLPAQFKRGSADGIPTAKCRSASVLMCQVWAEMMTAMHCSVVCACED